MTTILNYSPGSQVTVLLEILNESDLREDGYSAPFVQKIILPDLSESSLYPIQMVRLSTGLYYHKFALPPGRDSIGTYIVDLTWTNIKNEQKQKCIQVICSSSAVENQFKVSAS